MPTPTAKNSEDIASLGKNFDVFRATTDQSLKIVKWVGGPLLLAVLAIGVKMLGDVGELKGDVKGQSGRLDRIEKVLETLAGAAAKAPGPDRAEKVDRAIERVESLVSYVTATACARFAIDPERETTPQRAPAAPGAKNTPLLFNVDLDLLYPREPRHAATNMSGRHGIALLIYPLKDESARPQRLVRATLFSFDTDTSRGVLEVDLDGEDDVRKFRRQLQDPKRVQGVVLFDLGIGAAQPGK